MIRERVVAFVRHLLQETAVFVDCESLRSGDRWKERIAEALASASDVLVLWSWSAEASDWVKGEVETAIESHRRHGRPRIRPILLDSTPLAFGLDEFQAIDLRPDSSPSRFSVHDGMLITVPILGSAAIHYALRSPTLSLFVTLATLWLTILSFAALRSGHAPWNRANAANSVSMLMGTIQLSSRACQLLMVSSIACTVVGLIALYV